MIIPYQPFSGSLHDLAHHKAVFGEAFLQDTTEMIGYGAHKADLHRFTSLKTQDKSLDEGYETAFHKIMDERHILMLASKLGKGGQIFGRLVFMLQLLDEILQLQMIFRIKFLPQILRHEAIEISPHHFPADVHATAFVTDHISQRYRFLNDICTIIKT